MNFVSWEKGIQKNYKWYVRKFVGKINGESMFKNDEFHSGYKFTEV